MFGKLFQKSEYLLNKTSETDLNIYEFYNENEVYEICSKFNFELLIQTVKNSGINCNIFDNNKYILNYKKEEN